VSHRFVTRAALSSFALAFAAAVLTALATGGVAALLLERAEDRRLQEAAVVLGAELKDPAGISRTVEEEQAETTHMGVVFAVFDANQARLAGDRRLSWMKAGECDALSAGFRACAIVTGAYVVVAGASYSTPLPLLFAAALLAALFASALAFVASRPVAANVVAPLLDLQRRLQSSGAHAELGADSGVLEVEALRAALSELLKRVDTALAHATRFAVDAAHELRTPLSTILAELELLTDTQPPPETVARLRATVSRLSVLVERLLILATPGVEGATELVSLRDVVEDTVQALPAAERSRVQLEMQDDLTLRGDATLLASLVSNAVSNGLKFGRTVTVKLTGEALQVDDDGPGLPLEERKRVFEPLYRGQTARAAGVAGHGLGLALIAHVARHHHGTATFEDGAKGARLTIRFERR